MVELPEEERISFTEWFRIIFKKWKIILTIFLLVFFVSLFFNLYTSHVKAKKQIPVYTASAKIIIGPEALEAPGKGGEMIRRVYSYSNELSLLESDIVARQAAAVLKEKYGYEIPEEGLIREVRKSLKVSPPPEKMGQRRENIVDISATSTISRRAHDIVNAVLEGYQRQKKEDEDKFFRDTYRTFTLQLNAAHKNLSEAEKALNDFIMVNEDIAEVIKTYGLSKEDSKKGVLTEDSGISGKYLKVKSEISSTEDFINNIERLVKKDKLQAFALIAKRYDQFVDLNLKKALQAKEEELRGLLLINEDVHPEVIRAKGEMASIENKIDNEIENAIESVRLDLNTLKAQEKELSRLIEADVHNKIIEYNTLRRDIMVKNDIYNKFAEDLQRLNIGDKLKRYSEIRVLEPAEIPTAPSNPAKANLGQIVLFSLSIATFTSIGSVYIMEMLDTSIRDVEQLERLINMPVLVMIPWHRKYKSKTQTTGR